MLTEEIVAGPEGDALIAEKVMRNKPAGLPYTTDIAAAWQVVEHFPSDKYWRFQLDTNQGEPWMAFFGRGALEGRWRETWAIGNADTAPLAICRAALKAVA